MTAPAAIWPKTSRSPRARAAGRIPFADPDKDSATGPLGRVIARDVQACWTRQGRPPRREAAYNGGVTGHGLGGRVS